MATTYLALLRGINVGGKNKLPMKDLAALFEAADCCDVRTFIQSGNVVFQAAPRLAAKVPGLIAEQIAARFGYRTPVVLRSAEQMTQLIQNNPFLKSATDPNTLHVMFLADRPSAALAKGLDPERSAPDRYTLIGQDIYMQLFSGVSGTKLTNAYFDSKLATVSTIRNWRSVLQLEKMVSGGSP
jgi:uncharacterized protein (DUF1697 family)